MRFAVMILLASMCLSAPLAVTAQPIRAFARPAGDPTSNQTQTQIQTLSVDPDSSTVFYFPHFLGRIPTWSYDVGVSHLLKFFTIMPILVDDDYILFEAYSTSTKPERVTISIYYR